VVSVRVVEGVRGNVDDDPDLASARDRHRDRGTLERVQLDDTQRRRSRFRVTTDAGTELGVVASGAEPLAPGDVLLEDDIMVVVELAETPALAVTFPANTDPTAVVVVGHTAGNRHWDLAVDGGTVYVPAGPDPAVRRETLEPVLPANVSIEQTTVQPSLFDDASNADGTAVADADEHTHTEEHEHAHGGSDRDHDTADHNSDSSDHDLGANPLEVNQDG
jgi:urease accessory protein